MNFLQKFKLNQLRKKVQRAHALREQRNNNADVQAEIFAQTQLALFYDQHYFDEELPHAQIFALECYRVNAGLGDAQAQYICGQRLLEQGKFWETWSRNPIYAAAVHKQYAALYFEQAFAYLRTAEQQDYVLAKRLLGLVHIHGWGVPADTDKGFKMVLDSIELEKAWARATKILEELKLDSPEFFTALRTYSGRKA